MISRLDASSRTGRGMEIHFTDCVVHIMSLVGPWVAKGDREALE